MDKVWCPRCDKGWVLRARVKRTDEAVWVCEKCDALWAGPLRPEGPGNGTAAAYLAKLGAGAEPHALEFLARWAED